MQAGVLFCGRSRSRRRTNTETRSSVKINEGHGITTSEMAEQHRRFLTGRKRRKGENDETQTKE
jgi:hypothetical protein